MGSRMAITSGSCRAAGDTGSRMAVLSGSCRAAGDTGFRMAMLSGSYRAAGGTGSRIAVVFRISRATKDISSSLFLSDIILSYFILPIKVDIYSKAWLT